jgi:hypothetical protein
LAKTKASTELERVKGIEPSVETSQAAHNQSLPTLVQADYTQGHAQIPDVSSPDLTQVVAAWVKLSPPLKAAILAIVNSSEANR